MKRFRIGWRTLGGIAAIACASASFAASPISNSLTGFNGTSPTPAIQTALAGIGLEFSNPNGADPEDPSLDPTIVFGPAGAAFGSISAGDVGRNYIRTIESYAFDSYVAEVTVTVDTLQSDQTFFGMGSGNIALWGSPDFAGVPFVFMTPEGDKVQSNAADGISGDWMDTTGAPSGDWQTVAAPGLVAANAGTHRLRMTFNADTKEWFGSVDIDYAGGAFVADVNTPVFDLTNAFDDGEFIQAGWPTNPSKIFFGGDDGAAFKDFSVTIGAAPPPDANFNDDDWVDGEDFLIWQRGFGGPGANGQGDADGSTAVDGADLAVWSSQFGGPGAAGAAAGVPEPAAAALAAGAALLAASAVRNRRQAFRAH